MEKVVKGLIIGACVCIVVGIAFFIGAACAGGISGAKSILENGGIAIGIQSDDFEEYNTATEHVISLSDMDTPSLELELDAGEFEIIESNVKDIVVKSSKKINVSTSGDTIKINTPKHFVFVSIGFMKTENKITIEIPKGMKFDEVTMQIGAGELDCPNIISNSLYMELGAGTITLEAYTCDEATISVGAGEIIVGEGTAKDMDIDVGMGNFVFRGAVNGDLDVDCGMGNVQMWLNGSEKDYNYQIDCGMGNVTVGNTSYGGVGSNQDIDNDAPYNCDLDCGMGNLEIRFEE